MDNFETKPQLETFVIEGSISNKGVRSIPLRFVEVADSWLPRPKQKQPNPTEIKKF
jgi:hypothetical protein